MPIVALIYVRRIKRHSNRNAFVVCCVFREAKRDTLSKRDTLCINLITELFFVCVFILTNTSCKFCGFILWYKGIYFDSNEATRQ